ncbi:hypothetical protein A2U01_0103760, partial [Trifolium medium]|nr:hypothetical protein [Trifolium medium]
MEPKQPNRTLQAAIRWNDDGGGLNEMEEMISEKVEVKTEPSDKEMVVRRQSPTHHHPSKLHRKK